MSAPIITTLGTPNPASGNTTTDGTEQTLFTATVAGVFQLAINCVNMVDGDTIELRLYSKANSSDAESSVYFASFSHTQSDKIKVALPVATALHYKATIKRTSGTDRAYQWSVQNMSGA